MLLKLRGGLDSFLVTILLGLLIGAFAIWGIGPNMLAGSNQTIATVGETDIPTNRYFSQVQSRAQQMQLQFGGQISTPEIIRMMRLDEQILQQLIVDASIAEHMSQLGMRAGDNLVRNEMGTFEGFLLPDGTLSKEMIQQALTSAGVTEKDFLNDVRNGVSRRHLLGSLLPENALPRYFAEKLYVWEAERRRATMLNIAASDITDIAAPTEEEITAYYDNNQASYMAPERRSYSYIMLTPAQFADTVEVTEEDIQDSYDARAAEYIQPERRALQQVNFADMATAGAFISAISADSNFVEAATAVSDFTADEIDLGEFAKDDIAVTYDEATADAVFSLTEGGITAPLEAFNGYSVFKVVSITPSKTTTLEEAREEIVTAYKADEAIELMYDFLPNLEEAVADDPTLTVIAEKLSLPLATVTSVDVRGQSEAGSAAVTSEVENTVLQQAFRSTEGQEIELLDLDPTDSTKGVYLVFVDTLTETALRPLGDVRSDVVDAWTARAKQEKAGELAEIAKERLLAGAEAEALAEELGGTSFTAKNIVRTGGENASLSNNIRRLIFETPKGTIDFERAADGNGYIVVRVDEVTPGDATANAQAVDARLAELNTQMSDDIFAQYQAHLLSSYPPIVNRTLQQQLFADPAAQE